ncbi:hypothetical protein HK096_006009, partial [Nowakowskiella sp. JEL0078]
MHFNSIVIALFFLFSFSSVNAHGLVTEVTGANGVIGTGFGVTVLSTIPRDCTKRNPCQQDTSIIRAREANSGRATACGRTLANGAIDIETELSEQETKGNGVLPSIDADGVVSLTIHQINGDGGGPYTAEVDTTGTGDAFKPAKVLQNVPGVRGNSRKTQLTDHPVKVQIPKGTVCKGGANGNACLLRLKNPALAGPFGGCVAVQQDAN